MHKSSLQGAVRGGIAACALTLAVSHPAVAGSVRFDSGCTPLLTGFDRVLYEKAGEGTGVLRRYVESRRGILQQDVYDTAVWAAGLGEARKRCIGDLHVAAAGAPAASPR